MDITPINGFKNTRCTTLDYTVYIVRRRVLLWCTRSSFHTLLFAHVTIFCLFFLFTPPQSANTYDVITSPKRFKRRALHFFFFSFHSPLFFLGVLHNRRHSLLTASIFGPIWDLWFSRIYGAQLMERICRQALGRVEKKKKKRSS